MVLDTNVNQFDFIKLTEMLSKPGERTHFKLGNLANNLVFILFWVKSLKIGRN